MKPSARLRLTMIVKDEVAIIERCLAAATPWIDSFCVLDTGSTDGTQDLIRAHFAATGIPGTVEQGHFVDFAQARNDSLAASEAAGGEFDYYLLCDADMELVVEDPDFASHLGAAAYHLTQRSEAFAYANLRLLRRDVAARYRGATHEYLDLGGRTAHHLAGAWFRDHSEGSSRVDKYERDLRLLRQALLEEPDDARNVFYLAQTYRDMGDLDAAIEAYRQRVAMGGWEEEVWYSLLQMGMLHERLGHDDDTVLGAYLAAFDRRPTRAEPLVELARYYREHGPRHTLSHLFASRAAKIPMPADQLFVDHSAYGWRLLDELSIAEYWVGDFQESAEHARAALELPDLPDEHRSRVNDNLGHALRRSTEG